MDIDLIRAELKRIAAEMAAERKGQPVQSLRPKIFWAPPHLTDKAKEIIEAQ
jgi:hypothetical protein